MDIKDILVHIDNTKACEKRLSAAIQMAQSHRAHLTGLYVIPAGPIAQTFRTVEASLYEQRDAARTMFEAMTHGAALVAKWQDMEGDAAISLRTQINRSAYPVTPTPRVSLSRSLKGEQGLYRQEEI